TAFLEGGLLWIRAAQAEPPEVPAPGRKEETPPRRIGLADLLGASLLLSHDVLVLEGPGGQQQTATLTADGKINLCGEIFDSVSPAAIRALELTGKAVRSVNGWTQFRVLRGGKDVGLLAEVRAQYEDKEQEAAPVPSSQDATTPASDGPEARVLAAV